MSVLYVKEQGSCIQKRGERLIVSKSGKTLLDIPVDGVENIAVIGNVQLTTPALHMLMLEGIDVNFFTYSGKYLGQTASDSSKNIFLRFSQYELYNNLKRRLTIAKLLVENKIDNQIFMIRQYMKYDEAKKYDWSADINRLVQLKAGLCSKETSNEIMGVEGICSQVYFNSFGQMFHCDFEFHGRNRRPPRDPINVLISLGYTFLTKEVSSALDAESFEMYLGFLHGIRYGRKSLPLDIVEEFRQPAVDRFVILICNKRIINKFDFSEEEDAITLTEEGFKKFCVEFEKWMNGSRSVNYRNMIKRQVANLKKCILQKQEYKPYGMGEKDVSG